MIHDEMNLDGYAHFIFDEKLLEESDPQISKDLKDSFLEFIKAGVNVLPFDRFTISTRAIRENNEKPDVDILYIINKIGSVIEINMFSRAKPNKPTSILSVTFTDGQISGFRKASPVTMEQVARFSCSCMAIIMIINSHDVEREHVSIPEKLNKAREKSGKPSLKDYIIIKLSEASRERLKHTENGVVTYRKPHWRRGHLRHLRDGRIVPVSACIVNFNGDKVDPKTYIVKK